MAFVFAQDGLCCSVCLDLLRDPVTFPCGHSCCMNCITHCWNNQTQTYSCSRCHTPRPAVGNSVMFAEVMEKMEMFNLQTALPVHCNTGAEDVECDVCTLSKNKAVKSCLECLKSYCQTHLEEHNISYIFNQHNLMEPTRQLKEVICPKHRKHLEIYCRTDKQCICHLCTVEEHVNHEYVTVKAERTEKQMHLREIRRKVHQRIQEREKELQEVREAVESYKHSAHTTMEDSKKIFNDLIRSIQTCHLKVEQLIRDQGTTALSQAESYWNQLQQEIVDLKKRDAELEQLSHIDNHIHFLQSFQSLSVAPESTVSHNISVRSSLFSFDDVRKSVSQLKENIEDFCKEDIEDISKRVTYITIIRPNEPKTRNEFLQYASQFTLDSNTVNHKLCLSDGNRTATDTDIQQSYPYHPERFDYCAQVLCKESVGGRCYWEVEWTGSAGVYISVAYRTISRKTNEDKDLFGQNDQSWGVYCCPSSNYTPSSIHSVSVNAGAYLRLPQAIGRQITWMGGQTMTGLPVASTCSRIGVFVDHSAGTLSFYSVSDTMTLIHKIQTTFTQPLYPGFYVCKGSTVKMCYFTK